MKIQRLAIPMLLFFFLTACSPKQEMGNTAIIPVGRAFANGDEIFFMHTEASDEAIASLLTEMMNSPVLWVPSLAASPDEILANVYVFTNGIEGMGPLGYAADVFDNPPNSAGYSPLRRLNLVTWIDPAAALELHSATEVISAEQDGRVTVEQPGVVINMPFVVWQDGKR